MHQLLVTLKPGIGRDDVQLQRHQLIHQLKNRAGWVRGHQRAVEERPVGVVEQGHVAVARALAGQQLRVVVGCRDEGQNFARLGVDGHNGATSPGQQLLAVSL